MGRHGGGFPSVDVLEGVVTVSAGDERIGDPPKLVEQWSLKLLSVSCCFSTFGDKDERINGYENRRDDCCA